MAEAPASSARGQGPWLAPSNEGAKSVAEIPLEEGPRLSVSFGEMNRVLGGGLVSGSVVLMAGDPGIGKSTLLLQAAAGVGQGDKVLYATGEESAQQVKLRARRLGAEGSNLLILQESDIERILQCLEEVRPRLVVVDSIQAVESSEIQSSAGTVGQVRECAGILIRWAKARGAPMLLAGHVTKEGDVAGPRLLEHMVDVVLYLEGEPSSGLRVLRAVKNRFGPTNEVAFFSMGEGGLKEVLDPSSLFLSHRREGVPGSVIVPLMEGSRPLVVEVQALVMPSQLPSPRRTVTGLDPNRVAMICAVLWRHGGLPLGTHDVAVNVAGGYRVYDAAADLAAAVALASSLRNVPMADGAAALGELGLTGEVRPVPRLEERLRELSRLGLRRALVPAGAEVRGGSVQIVPVSTLREALRWALGSD